jgi:rhodanese-related sulfurtransferase
MRKIALLLITVLMVLAIAPVGIAQDDDSEVLEDVVMPRLEAYLELVPELDSYNTIRVDPFIELLAEDEDVVILDVREPAELEEDGIIDGAIHVPMRELGENLDLLPDLDATIVVVCKGGFRATIAMTALHVLGYENAHVLVGGIGAWAGENLPVDGELAEVDPQEVPEDIDPLLVEFVANYMAELPEGWGAVRAEPLFEEMFDTMPDLLLDVRSEEEWEDPGYIFGAEHIWINEFGENLDQLPEDMDADIVVYCSGSYRAGIVGTVMGMMGYENVRNLVGGVNAWIAADLPLETE